MSGDPDPEYALIPNGRLMAHIEGYPVVWNVVVRQERIKLS